MRPEYDSFVTPAAMSPARAGRRARGQNSTFPYVSQKIQKTSFSLLTLWRAADYIRLTNDGGGAASEERSSLLTFEKVGPNQESRVSDTRPAPSQKRSGPRHRVL